MQIEIDIDDPTPLFTQLIDQIKAGIKNGKLKPRDPLPSIRQLANDLNINNKTVAKAYKMMERDGVILTRGYRGTIIHPEAVANCDIDLNQIITDKLFETITFLKQSGATDSELRIVFGKILNHEI